MHPYRDAPCHPEAAPAEVDMEAEEARFADPCCGNCKRRGEGFKPTSPHWCSTKNHSRDRLPTPDSYHTESGDWCIKWAAR